MSSHPLVTVITATYNREDLLGETIDSVLAQNYPNLEYIVLDDGSKDNTKAVLERYEGKLTWYRHDNMGETATVNRGFEMAKGEIVVVLSSDDPMMPGAIQAGVDALLANPEAVVAYPDWVIIDDDGLVREEKRTRDYSFAEMVLWHDCVPGPSSFFRRSVLEVMGGRDPNIRYVADFDFWLRAARLGPFVRIPAFYGCFREHGSSLSTAARSPEMAHEHITLMDKFYSFDLPPEIVEIRKDAYSSAYFVAGCVVGADFGDRLRYFSKALLSSSWRFLKRQSWRIPSMAVLLLEVWSPVARFRHAVLDAKTKTPWKGKHYSLIAPDLTRTDS